MGKAKGTGGVTLGSPLPTNNFSFNIFVLGREDKQFGVIKSISIQTENFEDFFIKLNWENSVKTQGTLTGEIQILYASRKDKIETYFLTETNFSIFWWLELSNENKNQINQILEKYTLENLEYKKMIVNQNRKKQLIELRNSLSEIEIQKQNIKREIIDLNSKIKLLKSN
jgi:hypothetical protein